jgi:hypothetical protein
MGGGCSTKRSIAVNDAESKVNLKKNVEESKDDANQSSSNILHSSNKSKLQPNHVILCRIE